jgi:hypothetical protein
MMARQESMIFSACASKSGACLRNNCLSLIVHPSVCSSRRSSSAWMIALGFAKKTTWRASR